MSKLDTGAMPLMNSSIPGCGHKNRYETERLARAIGREFAAERDVSLYIYRCAFCTGWHLTKKERVAYWNVNADVADSDEYTDITGDPLFWHRLFEMPHKEAEAALRKLHRDVVLMSRSATGEEGYRLSSLLSRLKDEIHLISQVANNGRWTDSIRRVFGQEGLDKVLLDMRMAQSQDGD
jgi:hypothetical protein